MSDEQQEVLLMIKGVISELPDDKQIKIKEIYSYLSKLQLEDELTLRLAVGWKGAELAL